MKKKNIMVMITLALFVSFIFLFSITLSGAIITIVSPTNGTNHTGVAFFNVTYENNSDLGGPTIAAFFYNPPGATSTNTSIGNISCTEFECTGNLSIATLYDGIYMINVTLYNTTTGGVGINFNGTNFSTGIKNMTNNITFDSTPPNVTDFNISLSASALTTVTGKDGLNFSGASIVIFNVVEQRGIHILGF